MIGVRIDANSKIGMGHAMRCMAVAKEVKKLGEQVVFIAADREIEQFISENGYLFECLNTRYDNMESELKRLHMLIKRYNISTLLVDSYFVTKSYLSELRSYTRVAYMDDLASFPYPVDILINYNCYADELDYTSGYEEDTVFYLGCNYAPLREEFRNNRIREKKKNILITAGGTDLFHFQKRFLEHIIASEGDILYDYYFIIGKFNRDIREIEMLGRKNERIHTLFDITNMHELMSSCDLAITAGGSTMYELCACGVPMITYSFADNQLLGVRAMQKKNIACYCGDLRINKDDVIKEIEENVYVLMKDRILNNEISNRMKSLVDGCGAIRLAKILS